MKGVVFNLLEETVTRAFGPDTWDALLDASDVTGAYTSLGNYPDSEMEALVAAAGQALSLDRDAVLRWFGVQAIPVLAELYPAFFGGAPDARAFIEGVNTIIHAEVRKLYPGAECPHFRMHDEAGDLVMHYVSSRNMCALAQGFVEGTAAWYGGSVDFQHVACTARGDARCIFKVAWPISTAEAA
ncbi:heme NO-binding domain-containing protein [Brevundimonas sp.]|uniref:heme NO-binding domain-containing protein n=1 Tax=Brevundimonas sp. TaxID=1871086 RepID=UPI002D578F09|nr:heme NO-binding domain-containing protein [Brevundimonas sp.]HYC96489.1 heme NO-binding domain-containing protein [Brevundimonas sp.]